MIKQTHTRVVFLIKDEPLLDSIKKEFKDKNFVLKCNRHDKYTMVKLTVDTIIKVLPENMIMIGGYRTQYETLTHY